MITTFALALLGASAATPPEAAAPPQEGLKAIVRGLYLETQVGGGYMVLNDEVEPDAFAPGATGSEGMGPGSTILVSLGYDIIDAFALEIIGGAAMVAGTRSDKVRDLTLSFVGLGGRLAFAVSDRTNFIIEPGAIYVRADNGVEKPEIGTGAFGSLGFEYYVHVRHFSVGIELVGIVPVSPQRAFLALSPSLKYTF